MSLDKGSVYDIQTLVAAVDITAQDHTVVGYDEVKQDPLDEGSVVDLYLAVTVSVTEDTLGDTCRGDDQRSNRNFVLAVLI